MDDTLLARWLNGTLTEAEREALEKDPDYPAYQRIAEAASHLTVPDAETAKLWPQMKEAVDHAASEKTPPVRKARQRRLWYSAAAAVAALIVFMWWPWNKGPMLVQTGIGEQKTITLPDGSIVKMNAVSELSIETAAWSDVRQITLHGEAYFDVKKDPNAPFYVITTNGKVTVLGTSFSVFDREKTYEVACYRGLVKTESNGITMEIPETRKITSSGNDNWINSEVNEGDTPPWTKGESAFTNAPMSVVIAELERQYGIHVESKVAIEKQFTGAFPNKNLNLALEIICKALQLKYKENDGKNILLEDL